MFRIYPTSVCLLAHIGGSMSASGIGHGLKRPGNPPQTAAAPALPVPEGLRSTLLPVSVACIIAYRPK